MCASVQVRELRRQTAEMLLWDKRQIVRFVWITAFSLERLANRPGNVSQTNTVCVLLQGLYNDAVIRG
jgi:hypothetical protein